jgi:hypothetical protein
LEKAADWLVWRYMRILQEATDIQSAGFEAAGKAYTPRTAQGRASNTPKEKPVCANAHGLSKAPFGV